MKNLIMILMILSTIGCGHSPSDDNFASYVTQCSQSFALIAGGPVSVEYTFNGETPTTSPTCEANATGLVVSCNVSTPRSVVLTDSGGNANTLVFDPGSCKPGH